MTTQDTYLPAGLPAPMAADDGLDTAYWDGARDHKLVIQRCNSCDAFQWGPEWNCNQCLSFDVGWTEVESKGRIYSWERVWHPVHPALADACPYVVVLVELEHAGSIRMVGNLVGDREAAIEIGAAVEPVFEDHDDADPPFTLVHWRRVD